MGCGDDTSETKPKPDPPDDPPVVETCAAGSRALEDGGCQPPGVPETSCFDGFQPDGQGGCVATLPVEPCAAGQLALPGESACREVAPCGAGPFGDIPVEADTVYVQADYPGGDSDGSEARPYTTILDGIGGATEGAIVAIASGVYEESLVVDRPVRLWGVCPAEVEIKGVALGSVPLLFYDGASGSEVHDLAISGSGGAGVAAFGVDDLLLDRLWIHDLPGRGINVEAAGSTSVTTVRGTLVEGVDDLGVFALEGTLSMSESVVRDVDGWGMSGRQGSGLTLERSVIANTQTYGLLVSGSQATLSGVLIRDTAADAEGLGQGLVVRPDSDSLAPSTASVVGSVIERSYDMGVFVDGSVLTMQQSVVRDQLAQDPGVGIYVIDSVEPSARSSVEIVESLVAGSRTFGINAGGSDLIVRGTAVRDTLAGIDYPAGRGINVRHEAFTGQPATLLVEDTLVERSHQVGIFMTGIVGELHNVAVRDVALAGQGVRGWGIAVQDEVETGTRADVLVTDSEVERAHEVGIVVFDSTLTVERTAILDILQTTAGNYGDGVSALAQPGPALLIGRELFIDGAKRAGMASFGASVELSGSTLSCNPIDLNAEGGGTFSDLGGNECGCEGEATACKLQTSTLAPPTRDDVAAL